MPSRYGAAIVGGGFFGASLALMLAERSSAPVVLLEREPTLLGRASYNNQARVHTGYHYPRSILTAFRSRVNCPRFLADFEGCIDRGFRHYYAVARRQSQVTARQFELFCGRIGAPLRKADKAGRALFDPAMVEEVYEVEEFAFDAARVRERLVERLAAAKVEVRLGARARSVREVPGALELKLDLGALEAARVFNCTYSAINELLVNSQLAPVRLRHELTELALIEVPPELRESAVTVMCGPFFSAMPFPAERVHSLSHVRYTPHAAWEEGTVRARPASHFVHMVKDAARYLPSLAHARHLRSLFEVKTVLPQSEHDDSRPILFKETSGMPRLVSVMGGKIDNVYDLPRELFLLAS